MYSVVTRLVGFGLLNHNQVKNLACGFQQKDLLIKANLQKPDMHVRIEDESEVLKAAFIGDTVTNAAKILFNDGEDMLIDSTKMPISQPLAWSPEDSDVVLHLLPTKIAACLY